MDVLTVLNKTPVKIASFNEKSITNENDKYIMIKSSLEKSTRCGNDGGNKGPAIAARSDKSKEDIMENLQKVLKPLKQMKTKEDSKNLY